MQRSCSVGQGRIFLMKGQFVIPDILPGTELSSPTLSRSPSGDLHGCCSACCCPPQPCHLLLQAELWSQLGLQEFQGC